MILKALYDYYNRSLLENPNSLPLYGWMNSRISFVIIIQKNGNFVRLEDNRDETGKGKIFVLPYGVHTNSITPFISPKTKCNPFSKRFVQFSLLLAQNEM